MAAWSFTVTDWPRTRNWWPLSESDSTRCYSAVSRKQIYTVKRQREPLEQTGSSKQAVYRPTQWCGRLRWVLIFERSTSFPIVWCIVCVDEMRVGHILGAYRKHLLQSKIYRILVSDSDWLYFSYVILPHATSRVATLSSPYQSLRRLGLLTPKLFIVIFTLSVQKRPYSLVEDVPGGSAAPVYI